MKDFKGRRIFYLSDDTNNTITTYKNDAMEFLYTYTWGYESYACEVQEQYGYFSKSRYKSFIKKLFGEKLKIIKFDTYLQQGYANNLIDRIEFFDNDLNKIQLPDSNCLLVLEKTN
ncbi:hypothetical protein ACFHWD_03910 [Clostridium sp. MT-14]|uniref:hypothetical protein n=1 Tax=Clostridium sp. MT-14 TaxID=3348360 RepID=UPI0035F3D8E8